MSIKKLGNLKKGDKIAVVYEGDYEEFQVLLNTGEGLVLSYSDFANKIWPYKEIEERGWMFLQESKKPTEKTNFFKKILEQLKKEMYG